MNISMIAAVAANGVIGNNNHLPWHCPEDMRRFVQITKDHVVVMGRKTHESIGKLLPNRINFVLSQDRDYKSPFGATVYPDVESVLDFARYYQNEIVVIGGEQIYQAFLPYARKLYITNINAPFAGDAYFPSVHELDWVHVESQPGKHDFFEFSFDVYMRVESYKNDQK